MDALTKEYTDTKDIKHKVEHLIVPVDEKCSREQLLEDLFNALVKPRKHISV